MKALIQLAMLIPIIGLSLQGCGKRESKNSRMLGEAYDGTKWSGNGHPTSLEDGRGTYRYQFTDVQGCNYQRPAMQSEGWLEGCEVQGDGSVMYAKLYGANAYYAKSPEVDFTGWTTINVSAKIDATRGNDAWPQIQVVERRHICLEMYDLNTGSPGNNVIGQQCKEITASDGIVTYDVAFHADGRALNRMQFMVGVSGGRGGGPQMTMTTIGPTVHMIEYSASR